MAETARILLHDRETKAIAARLGAAHPDCVTETCEDNQSLPAVIREFRPDVVYSVRFVTPDPYPAAALLGEAGPRWLCVGGAGIDHLGEWDTDVTTVTNAAGVAADMMAEYILGTFLHFTLDIPGLQKDKGARRWDRSRLVTPIKGKTLLIIGLGQTGQSLARRAKAFGMRVTGTRARPCPMDNVDHVGAPSELPQLAADADFVAVTTPLVPATKGLVGTEFLSTLKPGAILSDVSRGGVTDHAALRDALESGRVAGAALDVFPREPLPPEDPIWQADNILISPHCSSVHAEWAVQSFSLFLENLDNWRAGRALFNIVDPQRGY